MTPEARRARGIAAKYLMDDPTLQAGWAELEDDLRAKWEAAWLPRTRDRIWSQLRHLKALRQTLASYAGQAPRD